MAVNVKLGVDIGEFKSGIQSGQQILKGLNAEMKASEATFKATGNAEQKLASQTKTLNSTIQVQKGIADQARKALDQMTKAGVDPADVSYQKLYATMMNAEAGMHEAEAAMAQLGTGANAAADGADKLSTGLNGISKKISLDQVISGIGKITDGLENAAKKAVKLGEDLWNAIMDSAKWADDTATMAQMYGIDLDTFQRMQKLVTGGMDTSVEAMLTSQDKLKKGIGKGSKEIMGYLADLHVGMREGILEDWTSWQQKDPEKLFWEVGQALMNMSDAYDKEAAATALFGKSWKELVPLFTEYKSLEEYTEALGKQNIVESELIENGAKLYDTVGELTGNWETLKNTLTLSLAPAMTDIATTLNTLLTSVLEYLQSEDGKQLLKELGESVTDLFAGLKDISAQDVVNGFKRAFDTVLGALDWIVENKDTLIGAVKGIFGVWATLEVSSGVLTILKVIDGLKSLAGLGTGTAAGGGLATTLGTWLTGLTTNAANFIGSGALQNVIPGISDWFVHNTGIGQELFLGTKEKGSTFKEIGDNATQWWNDYKNVLTNARDYWSGIWDQQREAAEWTLGDEYTSEEIMQMINNGSPVPVEVAPTPEEGAAVNIADQVGTVVLPVEFQIRSDYANLQGYILKQLTGHANGLPYVPNEGLYHLHQGERVVPAREVASRSYNSNLYVESMIMNNGTDAAGLASAMASAQRRTMSGFGS